MSDPKFVTITDKGIRFIEALKRGEVKSIAELEALEEQRKQEGEMQS